jgi:hypothetical protein
MDRVRQTGARFILKVHDISHAVGDPLEAGYGIRD